MSKISFRLNVATQRVSAQSSKADDAWFRVRRVFANETDHVEVDGERKIEFPLWLLLSKREALAYRLDEEKITFSFDKSLTGILARTVDQSDAYQNVSDAQLLTTKTLDEKLR